MSWVGFVQYLAAVRASAQPLNLLWHAVLALDEAYSAALVAYQCSGHAVIGAVELLVVHGHIAIDHIETAVQAGIDNGILDLRFAAREKRLGHVHVHPFCAEDVSHVGAVQLGRCAVMQDIAPALVARIDNLAVVLVLRAILQPAKTHLDCVLEGARPAERQSVHVGQVFEQLCFNLGWLCVLFLARQDLVIHSPALLGAYHPVDRLRCDVIDNGRLASVFELLGFVL